MIVQALVAEFAVEALDVGVLRRFAGCDQLQIDSSAIGPSVHRTAGELRPLVGANRPGGSPELRDLVEHVRNVAARDPVIDRDIQALSGEVIHDRQALDAPARRERIHHEIDATGSSPQRKESLFTAARPRPAWLGEDCGRMMGR